METLDVKKFLSVGCDAKKPRNALCAKDCVFHGQNLPRNERRRAQFEGSLAGADVTGIMQRPSGGHIECAC